MTLPISKLTRNQKKIFGPVEYIASGQRLSIIANVRYDDQCSNGHNTFSITGKIKRMNQNGRYVEDSGGCIHEEIAKYFPTLVKYIKWHLVSSDGPLHYIENTTYHAGDRDYNGRLKGEPYGFERKLMFNDVPFLYTPKGNLLKFIDEVGLGANWKDFEILEVPYDGKDSYPYKPKYTLALMPVVKWHEAPFSDWDEACSFIHAMSNCNVEIVKRATAYSEGKERNLDAARISAIWPEATDEQLSLPEAELTKLLLDRLPALMVEFKADMEELGFIY